MDAKPARRYAEALRGRRELVERMLNLAELLGPSDKALVQAVLDRGISVSQFARAFGRRPRTVRKRLHRLVDHVGSDRFQFIVHHRRRWPTRRRQVADLVFLRGVTQQEAARRLSITIHQLRMEIHGIETLCDSDAAEHIEKPEMTRDAVR